MSDEGPLRRQFDRVVLFLQQLCAQPRRDKWRQVMIVAHPERLRDEPSASPITAESVAEATWRELARSDFHPDKWQYLNVQLDTTLSLLSRLHAAIANGELCPACIGLFADSRLYAYRPSDDDVKIHALHEQVDHFVDRLVKNGKQGAHLDFADTAIWALTHKERPLSMLYDAGGNPVYREGYAPLGMAS